MTLHDFVAESNRIEGIERDPKQYEIDAHETLLALPALTVKAVEAFVHVVAGAPIRKSVGMNVRVGAHVAPPGGPEIPKRLKLLLDQINAGALSPWEAHLAYETLHPMQDGNGRSGRAIWLWQMSKLELSPFALPFLHRGYYQALQAARTAL